MKEKSLAKNAIFNTIYRLINMLFPLVTSMYVSHILMATGVGRVSTAQNIVQYFVLLAPLGLTTYGTREIAKVRDNREQTERLFTELFTINFCSTLIWSIVYYGMITMMGHFAAERLLYLVAGLPIVFNFINIEWFYQGNEDYVYIALRNAVVKMLSLIAIVSFVRTVDDYVMYALIYVLGIAGNYVFNIINAVKKGIRLSFSGIKISQHLKTVLIFLCSNIAIELYTLLDTSMLGLWCTEEVVGYYTNSVKLVKIVVSLISAIGGVLLPRLSYYKEQNMMEQCDSLISKVTKIMLLFVIPCGIGLMILAKPIVLVMFGETFIPAIGTIRIATILIYVLGFSNLFGTQVLLTFNQEKKLLSCTCIGAASNILMNSMLIPMYQHNGAVVASVISESIVTLMTILMSRKYIKVSVSTKYWIQIITSGLGMGLIVYILSTLIDSNLLCLIVGFLAGMISYFIIGYVEKNSVILDVIVALKRKLAACGGFPKS